MENKLDLILKELQKIFNQIDEKFAQVDTKFEQIDNRFEQIDNRIDNLSTEIGALHRTFFKLEVDSQKNFNLLFDSNKIHNDKELLFENQLYRLNDQLDNTNFRVSVLEDTSIKA